MAVPQAGVYYVAAAGPNYGMPPQQPPPQLYTPPPPQPMAVAQPLMPESHKPQVLLASDTQLVSPRAPQQQQQQQYANNPFNQSDFVKSAPSDTFTDPQPVAYYGNVTAPTAAPVYPQSLSPTTYATHVPVDYMSNSGPPPPGKSPFIILFLALNHILICFASAVAPGACRWLANLAAASWSAAANAESVHCAVAGHGPIAIATAAKSVLEQQQQQHSLKRVAVLQYFTPEVEFHFRRCDERVFVERVVQQIVNLIGTALKCIVDIS